MSWKKIRKFLPIIGIGVFIFLIVKLDVIKIFEEIKNLNLLYLPFIFIFIFIFLFIQPLKWFIIAKKQNIKIPFFYAFKINLISNFYGLVTPGKLGTIIRTDYLKRKGTETGKGLSNFVIEKILDLCSLFIFAIGFGLLFYKKILPPEYLYLLLILFGIILALFLIFCRKKNSKILLRFVYKKFIPNKFKEKSKILFNSFYDNFPSLPFLSLCLFVNLSVWTINYFIIYLIGLSLGIEINFIPFLAIMAVSTLVTQIPITINGFGTRELTLIGLFSLFGISAVKVFSMSVLNIIFIGTIPSLIAIYLIFRDKT